MRLISGYRRNKATDKTLKAIETHPNWLIMLMYFLNDHPSSSNVRRRQKSDVERLWSTTINIVTHSTILQRPLSIYIVNHGLC